MDESLKILEANGLSRTEVRKKILDLFLRSEIALSLSAIESSFEKLDRITLYRTLKTFEGKGIIHKAIDGTNRPKFAICKAPYAEGHHHDNHAHFHCTSCEKTVCLDHLPTPGFPKLDKGYQIQEMNVIFSGTCPECSAGLKI
ncbi:MAG: transcriptional repressor [Bacteroidota bacterium]